MKAAETLASAITKRRMPTCMPGVLPHVQLDELGQADRRVVPACREVDAGDAAALPMRQVARRTADAAADAGASDRTFADEIQAEDVAICEAVQRGLASGSYAAGRLNPTRESGVWHFQELLRAAIAATEPRK